MVKILPIIKKEILEFTRSKKLLILAGLFLFIAVASPITAKLIPDLLKNIPNTSGITINIPEPTWRDSIDQFVKNITQIGIIVIVFIFAGIVAEEKNKKTLEIVLSKPISRVGLIISKFAASKIVLLAIFIVSSAIFYLYTVSIFGNFSLINFFWLSLFILVFILLIMSITIFCSVLTSNQIIAAALAFFIEIVLITILGYVDTITKYLPGYILGNYKDLMVNGQISNFLPSVFTSVGLILLFAIFSILIFRRQEIER